MAPWLISPLTEEWHLVLGRLADPGSRFLPIDSDQMITVSFCENRAALIAEDLDWLVVEMA